MYSLVNAPVLGFDLARLQGGAGTAAVLLVSLSLTERDLPVLADRLPDDDVRIELWQDVANADRRLRTMRSLAGKSDAVSVALLERAPIGSLEGLLHCLRYDVLDWTWPAGDRDHRPRQRRSASRATALVCDALVASYLREELGEDTRRRLAAGWVGALRRLSVVPPELGPQAGTVTRLLDRVRALGPADLGRLARASAQARRDVPDWAAAMHAASWAVYLSGRIRAAAAAQLLLVEAVDLAGVPVADLAGGGWNALSGALHALTVRDLLDADAAHRLLAPVLTVLGPDALD